MVANGIIDHSIHCRRNDAEKCGEEMVNQIKQRFKDPVILHIGYQPGHVKSLASSFKKLYITDLNPQNIGTEKYGIKIYNGRFNKKFIKKADIVYITGSAISNGTLLPLIKYCNKMRKDVIIYGVTSKGPAKLLGHEVFCPYGNNILIEEEFKTT
jgi:uncharacterized protein (DUF4213/DUF364 family)